MPRKKYEEYKIIPRAELLLMRDECIRKDFRHHTRVKHLNAAYVVHEILQPKYFLEPETVWQICNGTYRGKYLGNAGLPEDERQLKAF